MKIEHDLCVYILKIYLVKISYRKVTTWRGQTLLSPTEGRRYSLAGSKIEPEPELGPFRRILDLTSLWRQSLVSGAAFYSYGLALGLDSAMREPDS